MASLQGWVSWCSEMGLLHSRAACESVAAMRVFERGRVLSLMVGSVFGSCKGTLDNCVLVAIHQVLDMGDQSALLFGVDPFEVFATEVRHDLRDVLHGIHVDLMRVAQCGELLFDVSGDGAADIHLADCV